MTTMPYTSVPPIGIWEPYTPLWTATGTAPAIGNGVILGSFILLTDLLIGVISITMGSTTTFGTGQYRLSIPPGFTAKTGKVQTCACMGTDAGTSYRPSIGVILSGGTTWQMMYSVNATEWSNTSPHTWAVNDEMILNYMLEIN